MVLQGLSSKVTDFSDACILVNPANSINRTCASGFQDLYGSGQEVDRIEIITKREYAVISGLLHCGCVNM